MYVARSCRPTESVWHNTIIVHFDKLYKLYNCQFSTVALYCRSDNFGWLVSTEHAEIEHNRNRDFSFKIESKSIVWLKSHIVTALALCSKCHSRAAYSWQLTLVSAVAVWSYCQQFIITRHCSSHSLRLGLLIAYTSVKFMDLKKEYWKWCCP